MIILIESNEKGSSHGSQPLNNMNKNSLRTFKSNISTQDFLKISDLLQKTFPLFSDIVCLKMSSDMNPTTISGKDAFSKKVQLYQKSLQVSLPW
jgi:hypothetical protein